MNTRNTIETLHRIIIERLAGAEEVSAAYIDKSNGMSHISQELIELNLLLQQSGGRAATSEEFLNHCLTMTSNRLMHVVQNLNYGVCVSDENNSLIFINQRFCNLFNCPVDPIEFIGKPCPLTSSDFLEMFHDPLVVTREHQQLMSEREPVRGEQVKLSNGRILLRDYCPIWNKHHFLGQIWIFEDITDRITSETKIDEQKKFYEDVLDKIPSDLVVLNTDREYLFANQRAIKDPFVRQWIIGKKDEDYFRLRQHPAAMLEQRVRLINEVISSGEQRNWEEQFNMKDGTVQHRQRCLYPAFDEMGKLKLLIGCGYDITEQKFIEEKIKRSEKRYRDLFNYSEALICTHDLSGTLNSVNPAVCKLLEYSEEEMIGRLISDLIPPDHKKTFQQNYLDPLIRDGKCKGVFCIISKSGQRIFLLFKNYKVDEEGVEPYVIGFSQDITDRVESEKELLLAKKVSEDTAKAKEIFLANMSHEIRTPMNGVLGFASLLVKTELNEQQRGYLKVIEESANNLLLIVNDVLDLEKILMGKLKLEQIDFPIAERIDMCVQTFTYKAEEKGIVLQSGISLQDNIAVIGDPYRLGQVLNNLINNALKFTDNGSITVHASVHQPEAGTEESMIWLEFSVSDTGIGIPGDKHKDIFEPFMQANTAVTRKYGGTGLGLSICRELVQLMGGKMFLESEPGKGSTFRFILPFGISVYKPKKKNMSQEINYQSLGRKRILVAEDVELNQYLARHIMESWGFEVEIAVNGREALRKVQEHDYDLVLMDIQMPEMDGMQATQHIRALEDKRVADIPIVALTANALKGDSEKYMAVGMNDYLSKPFDEPRLFQVISKNLDMRRPGIAQTAASSVGEQIAQPSVATPEAPTELINPDGGKLYDLSMVEAISGGDTDFVKRMVQLFLDTMPEALGEIEITSTDQRWEVLSKQAHKLKSTIDSMGIVSVKQLVRDIETNGKTNSNTSEIPRMVKQLVVTMRACMVQIKNDYSL